ncbi:arsenite efflux transporter metallochaperone ArsD [Neorhodopirellula pilleata]|uniref:Arsenical resistance operon trans-acting repressor ArsD n=1 Tax=Neorhodopirellula pilleata TaxID=2714738 RepID=A0A5C6AWT7_9BACT|nr:arsenite efflux transporter metallochaperone ArsD [Neorhodopirellula pilleata]TWU03502.1 Arsenical resistance operon trans-acting repressor ArsD [Neorhodopirellula pilleata]
MPKVQIFDKAMCCSTGVCGPQVDSVLPKFAADLEWLQAQGHDVERFNLAQDPAEFVKNATVQQWLTDEGVECLPLVIVDQRVVSRSEYPTRENLALWTGTSTKAMARLPMASDSGCCGGDSGCC